MKQTPLIISIVSLAGVIALALILLLGNGKKVAEPVEGSSVSAQKGAIVYFNLDTVINEYDLANDLRSVVETKAQSITEEINRRGNKLQKEADAFQEKINKGLITRSVAEVQAQKLQQQQEEFQMYANEKQQEIGEEQTVMLNRIADAIKQFVDKYNAEKEFAMIIATQGDILPSPVVSGDTGLDITAEILEGLNAEYIKEKNKSDKK